MIYPYTAEYLRLGKPNPESKCNAIFESPQSSSPDSQYPKGLNVSAPSPSEYPSPEGLESPSAPQ